MKPLSSIAGTMKHMRTKSDLLLFQLDDPWKFEAQIIWLYTTYLNCRIILWFQRERQVKQQLWDIRKNEATISRQSEQIEMQVPYYFLFT